MESTLSPERSAIGTTLPRCGTTVLVGRSGDGSTRRYDDVGELWWRRGPERRQGGEAAVRIGARRTWRQRQGSAWRRTEDAAAVRVGAAAAEDAAVVAQEGAAAAAAQGGRQDGKRERKLNRRGFIEIRAPVNPMWQKVNVGANLGRAEERTPVKPSMRITDHRSNGTERFSCHTE
jgi:hypothetical protein